MGGAPESGFEVPLDRHIQCEPKSHAVVDFDCSYSVSDRRIVNRQLNSPEMSVNDKKLNQSLTLLLDVSRQMPEHRGGRWSKGFVCEHQGALIGIR
jgi:hypothetical protein